MPQGFFRVAAVALPPSPFAAPAVVLVTPVPKMETDRNG